MRAGYVILQYLPLCYKSYQKPTCEYTLVKGKGVERVIPYNTLMKSKTRPKELGPEGRWADTDLHCERIKKNPKRRSLKSEDWEVTMKWAQMVSRLFFAAELNISPLSLDESRGGARGVVYHETVEAGVRFFRRGHSPAKSCLAAVLRDLDIETKVWINM